MIDNQLKPMRRIFDEEQLRQLHSDFESGEYNKTQLALKNNCSVTTVCLWLNPDEAVRESKFKSRVARTACECGKHYTRHKKCRICKVHTHSEEEIMALPDFYRYGAQTKCKDLCDACFEQYENLTITLRGYYKIGDIYEEYTLVVNPYTKKIFI